MLFPEEKDLIPYEPAKLPPGPWLVFAPHPDDETMGMGGTLYLASQAGVETTVVLVTDGRLAGSPERRLREALCAARLLGLTHLIPWNIPDRKVYLYQKVFIQKCQNIFNQKNFKVVFLPSLFEFHPDHRATAFLGLKFLKENFPDQTIWFYEISRQAEINRLIDISQVVEKKRKAIRCYHSQLLQNAYEDVALAINRARAYTLGHLGIQYAEAFWATKTDLALMEFETRMQLFLKVPFRLFGSVAKIVG